MGLREWWYLRRAKSYRKVQANAEKMGWTETAATAAYLAAEQEEEALNARFNPNSR